MRKKKWIGAATGATLGALLLVGVHEGKVQLSNGGRQLLLSRGEAGAVGEDGMPERVDHALTAQGSKAKLPPVPDRARATREPSSEQRQLRERVLGSLREREARRAAASAAAAPTASAGAPGSHDGTMVDKTGTMGEEMKVINHELMPLIDQCIGEALERRPHLHGMLAVGVKLASAEGVGSIFESVESSPRSEVHDDELVDCVRQSAFTIQLPAPKADRRNAAEMTIPIGPIDAGTR